MKIFGGLNCNYLVPRLALVLVTPGAVSASLFRVFYRYKNRYFNLSCSDMVLGAVMCPTYHIPT